MGAMGKDDPLYWPLPDSYQIPPVPRRSWWATGGAVIAMGFSLYQLGVNVPKFSPLYDRFGSQPSDWAKVLLALSRPEVLGLLVIPALIYPWWVGHPSAGRPGRILRILSGWGLIVLWFGSAVALFSPLIGLPGPLRK